MNGNVKVAMATVTFTMNYDHVLLSGRSGTAGAIWRPFVVPARRNAQFRAFRMTPRDADEMEMEVEMDTEMEGVFDENLVFLFVVYAN